MNFEYKNNSESKLFQQNQSDQIQQINKNSTQLLILESIKNIDSMTSSIRKQGHSRQSSNNTIEREETTNKSFNNWKDANSPAIAAALKQLTDKCSFQQNDITRLQDLVHQLQVSIEEQRKEILYYIKLNDITEEQKDRHLEQNIIDKNVLENQISNLQQLHISDKQLITKQEQDLNNLKQQLQLTQQRKEISFFEHEELKKQKQQIQEKLENSEQNFNKKIIQMQNLQEQNRYLQAEIKDLRKRYKQQINDCNEQIDILLKEKESLKETLRLQKDKNDDICYIIRRDGNQRVKESINEINKTNLPSSLSTTKKTSKQIRTRSKSFNSKQQQRNGSQSSNHIKNSSLNKNLDYNQIKQEFEQKKRLPSQSDIDNILVYTPNRNNSVSNIQRSTQNLVNDTFCQTPPLISKLGKDEIQSEIIRYEREQQDCRREYNKVLVQFQLEENTNQMQGQTVQRLNQLVDTMKLQKEVYSNLKERQKQLITESIFYEKNF